MAEWREALSAGLVTVPVCSRPGRWFASRQVRCGRRGWRAKVKAPCLGTVQPETRWFLKSISGSSRSLSKRRVGETTYGDYKARPQSTKWESHKQLGRDGDLFRGTTRQDQSNPE